MNGPEDFIGKHQSWRSHGLLKSGGSAVSTLLLVLFLGFGCHPGPVESADKVRLTLLVPGGYITNVAAAAMARLEADHPEIEVEILNAPGKDYYVKGLAMMAAGTKLDLLWMGQSFGLFSFRNALLDLTPYVRDRSRFDLTAYYQPVVDWYRQDGGLYGIPYGIDIQAMVYNRDIFDRAGLPHPSKDWTFADYVKTARQLTAQAESLQSPLKYGAGIDVVRPFFFDLKLVEDGRFGANNPRGREWLQLNFDLLQKEKSFLRVGAQGTLDRLGEFVQQRIAMAEVFCWDIRELRKRARFNWELVPMPLTNSGRRAGWGSSSGFSIAASTKYPDQAWLALTYLVSEEYQRAVMQDTVPSLIHLQQEYVQANGKPPENLGVFLEMLPFLEPAPHVENWPMIAGEWDYWMQLSLQGGRDPGDVLARAEESINRILGTSQKTVQP